MISHNVSVELTTNAFRINTRYK